MAWTSNGTFPDQTEFTGSGTLDLNNTTIGDLIPVIAISVDSTSNWINNISGGGCTWTQIGSTFHGVTNGMIVSVWQGVVNAIGAHTATVTATGGGPTIAIANQEFASSVGSWTVDDLQFLDSAGTATWPALTPSGSGELGFGFAIDSGIAVAGSTSGWIYKVTSHQDACAWNTNISSPSAPSWGDAHEVFGAMILFKETSTTPPSRLLTASII